jgi:hypothetical protein
VSSVWFILVRNREFVEHSFAQRLQLTALHLRTAHSESHAIFNLRVAYRCEGQNWRWRERVVQSLELELEVWCVERVQRIEQSVKVWQRFVQIAHRLQATASLK